MRNAVVSVSALTLVLAVGCAPGSSSGSDEARDLARAASLRSELAGSATTSRQDAIVSDLEVPPTPTPTAARASRTRNGNAVASAIRPSAGAERPKETFVVAAPVVAVTTPISAAAVEPQLVEVPAPRADPTESSGEFDGAGGPAAERPRPNPGVGEDLPRPRPGIIIRGGPVTGRDPCAIHVPGPRGGVMVNDRLPTRPGPTMGGIRPVGNGGRLPGIRG